MLGAGFGERMTVTMDFDILPLENIWIKLSSGYLEIQGCSSEKDKRCRVRSP